MTTEYWVTEQLQEFGTRVAQEFHAEKLASANFLFVFKDPPQKRGDTLIVGKASKVPQIYKDIERIEEDFIITIARQVWVDMSDEERKAVIDHELTHCGVEIKEDGSVKLSIVPHEIEDFVEVYKRHGNYHESLVRLTEEVKNRMEAD